MSDRPVPSPATASRPALQVTAGVVAHANSVLVCQRPSGSRHAGKWEFPGGKREGNESLEACLRRELDEELGIAAEIGDLLWHHVHCYPDGDPFELYFYLVPSYRGRAMNRIFAQIRWVPLGALAALDFLDADREFVERLDRGEWKLGGRQ